MSTNRTYIIMKNGVKIKTTKSLNSAKAFADQEQAEVFCNGEKVYEPINTAISVPIDEQKDEEHSPVSDEKSTEELKSTEDKKLNVSTDDKKSEQNVEQEVEDRHPKAYRIKALMNVRKAPSLNAERIAAIEAGRIVNVYEIKDDWMKVKWYEGFAYILYKNGEFAEPAKG